MATKQELLDAYKGVNPADTRELPVKLIQLVVEQIKSFLLGDGYEKKIKFLAINPEQQEQLSSQLDQIQIYKLLNDLYTDVPIYGETYIEVLDGKLRHIRTIDVDDVKVDPLDPLKIVYLKENREIYDPISNKYNKVKVEHYLTLPTESQTTLDLFNLPDYKYFIKVGGNEPIEMGDHIPIVRVVNGLDGRTAQSAIERLIHLQLEYNEVRSRINLNGKHHKPQVYTIGTSAPTFIGRSNASPLEGIQSSTGSSAFRTAFTNDGASILHLPISSAAADIGISPQIGYLQPVDSLYLERQRLIILQDIYSLSGVMVLELQNARSASSSSSLSVLYEPLQRATLTRANYLISVIKTIFLELGITIPFRVELPDMMPKNIEDKKLQIEAVKNKLISRKRYLVEVEGLTQDEALKELEQLDAEKGLNIQYSAALVDSKDAPNTDENTLFEDSVIN
ncbi:MAG: hypothetical protein ACSI46_16185 [Gloeotrichia echinulata DVL01]